MTLSRTLWIGAALAIVAAVIVVAQEALRGETKSLPDRKMKRGRQPGEAAPFFSLV
jgi:hypothetical protein